MTDEPINECRFATDRLVVDEWHRLAARHRLDLVQVVGSVLTEATTSALPSDWRGDFDAERAVRWVEARDAESPTLLVLERATQRAVGLLILYQEPAAVGHHSVDVRFGYILADAAWGRGLTTELVGGLVGWAREEPDIQRLVAGVDRTNAASARVLLKNGFTRAESTQGGERYEMGVRSTA